MRIHLARDRSASRLPRLDRSGGQRSRATGPCGCSAHRAVRIRPCRVAARLLAAGRGPCVTTLELGKVWRAQPPPGSVAGDGSQRAPPVSSSRFGPCPRSARGADVLRPNRADGVIGIPLDRAFCDVYCVVPRQAINLRTTIRF